MSILKTHSKFVEDYLSHNRAVFVQYDISCILMSNIPFPYLFNNAVYRMFTVAVVSTSYSF